jgi:hypothetical protein
MTRQGPPLFAEQHILEGPAIARNDTFRATLPRNTATTNNAIGATGVAHATAIALQAGDVVTSITFVTATTAAATPTAGFIALYDATVSQSAPTLMAQSADFGSTARAANTAYTVSLATAQTITTAGLYYVSISFTAGTVPTLAGMAYHNAVMSGIIITGMPTMAWTHGSAVGATAPATIASGTAVATPCYYIIR